MLWEDTDKELVPENPKYWLEVDKETGNPKGNACWSYYPGDKPSAGFFIEVEFTGRTNTQEETMIIDPNRSSGAV